jgi:hypothetical protein
MTFDTLYLLAISAVALITLIYCIVSAVKYHEEAAIMYIVPMGLVTVFYALFAFVILNQTERAYIGRGVFMSTILMIWLMRYNRIRRNGK